MYQAFMGSIQYYAFSFAPKNWAQCNGQLIAIAQNQALFALLGTTYGGNGVNTFGLPDLRGRTIIGAGQGNHGQPTYYSMGQMGGQPFVTMNLQQLPMHTHTLGSMQMPANDTGGDADNPSGKYPAKNPSDNEFNTAAASGQFMGAPQVSVTVAGSSVPFNNQAPYLVLNACVCLYGIFPSRN